MDSPDSLFTLTSLYSFLSVLTLLLLSLRLSSHFLPTAPRSTHLLFTWLSFDALIHFIFEGSFLALSLPVSTRSVNASTGVFAELWKEYARADSRWGVADPTVVSLELLTVLGAGPLCCYCAWRLVERDRAVHYWLVVLSTAEIYGGWMTFAPEWITGSPSLNTSNALHLWVYLFFMNMIWVVIPLVIMWDSYGHISRALRDPRAYEQEVAKAKIA